MQKKKKLLFCCHCSLALPPWACCCRLRLRLDVDGWPHRATNCCVAFIRSVASEKQSMCSAKIFIALMPGIHHSPHGGKFKKNAKFRKYANTSFAAFGAAQHSLQICCDFVRCQVLVFQRTAGQVRSEVAKPWNN